MSNTQHIQHFILIDDNDIDQLLNGRLLELVIPDAKIKLYTDARVALNYVSTADDHSDSQTIIFLDIQMPVMNGFQFLEAFHLLPDSIKSRYIIYMLSSSVNQFDISKAKNNPYVKDMIFKPLTKEILVKFLHSN